jgi:hypothetical protein
MRVKILSAAEVAARLGVCHLTVLRLARRGHLRPLPGLRIKKFTEHEVARYLALQPMATAGT